uniref:Uncharacterized protein n=1 Tax=viral metagenome TaxID=1070528 RepID=A0A6C0BXZ2_9ZZZZ
MSIKIIQISVPVDSNINISDFSPEENLLIIKIGISCLLEGRKSVLNLTQKEIQQKIQNDFKDEIQKLEMNILCEKETSKKIEERMEKMYDTQILQMKKQIDLLSTQLKEYEMSNKEIINKELNKAKEKYELLLQEKDKQNQLNREVFDKAIQLTNKNVTKSSCALGDDGENIFEYLSDTFKDFNGYKIENKSKQGHKGDFHLFFEEFNVLVDSKNYSGTVQKKEVNKIETDLMINDNMKFAWMVSLNTNISEYNRFPISCKWITTDVGVKCILFINNLLANKEPSNVLRQAWYICNEFNKMTKKIYSEDVDLSKYRERELKQKKQIENLQERASELRRSINTSHNILKQMDNDLIEMLMINSDKIINNNFELNNKIKEWCENNIKYTENDGSKLTSTEIWMKFKKENKEYVQENKITIDLFKDELTSLIDNSKFTEKTKKSAIEFIGFEFKQNENVVIEKKELQKKNKNQNPITITTEVLNKFYLSEYQDNKIIDEYENESNNIMTISSQNNIRPWQVVSLLIRHKKIFKREEARGYDIYKETEEYKQKIIKK